MTAEVAIMNRNALVFAADSATTVTSWSSGEKQVRFFKGANKLFQLSQGQPVGLMINGSASMHEVPWEIVVKEFRYQLGTDRCDELTAYGERFFDFVRTHRGLFPDEVRKGALVDNAVVGVMAAVHGLHERLGLADQYPSPEEAKYLAEVAAQLTDVRAQEAPPPLTREIVDSAVTLHLDEVEKQVVENLKALDVRHAAAAREIAELGIRLLMIHYSTYLESTGVVIGGYGTDQYFPAFDVYDCYGFLDSHLLAVRRDARCRVVNSSTDVAIEPFATTSMINTFRTGIGPDVFETVVSTTDKSLRQFANDIRDAVAPGVEIPDLEGKVAAALQAHRDNWSREAFRKHYQPLARVISSLPLPDMAALAKSLIELQSLKERVTEPTESVAGPIDVAATSKHDGFVWIERKHYFRPELNPRFFARQSGISRA